jgi:hypothetical protein
MMKPAMKWIETTVRSTTNSRTMEHKNNFNVDHTWGHALEALPSPRQREPVRLPNERDSSSILFESLIDEDAKPLIGAPEVLSLGWPVVVDDNNHSCAWPNIFNPSTLQAFTKEESLSNRNQLEM